ncbi:helix-turn-helix domain-containing protein [Tepidiforma sp.]|uniref:helix-turn-helix domain-containing protein n=1 Tax=Tepidiforma sp. TaxID=2682230 RepID=UPI00345BC25A
MTFAAWLQGACSEVGMTQSQLATYVGVSPSTVNRWWHGLVVPDPDSCARIAQVLHVPLTDVLRAAGHPVPGDLPADRELVPSSLRALFPLLSELTDEELQVMRHTALGLLELREARARHAAERRDESPPPAARSRPGKRRPRQPGPQRPPSA